VVICAQPRFGPSFMNSTQRELWIRLEAFGFDEPGTALTFTRRLARENGWTHFFAERVVTEYRRFVFLSMEAGHPVSPSEEVDQAWHLHLTYTQSYWQHLCAEVLGRRLHHNPTKGGADEAAKFDGQYQRTLDSYRRLFGKEPPADIWMPAGGRKHAKGGSHRWVDTKRYWVMPKWIVWSAVGSCGASMVAATVSGCSFPVPGMAATGPFFLGVFVILMFGGLVAAVAVRHFMIGPGGKAEAPDDPYELAYLVGGGQRVLKVALANLYAAKAVRVDAGSGRDTWLMRAQVPERALHDVEVLMWGLLPDNGVSVSLGDIQRGLRTWFGKTEDALLQKGLLSANATRAARVGLAILLVAPFVGLIRIGLGLANGRAVGFLIFMVLFGLFLAWVCFARWRKSKRSRQGNVALKEIRRRYRTQSFTNGKINPALIPLGVAAALFGPAVLPAYGYGELAGNLKKSMTDSGGGCGTSCGSGCGGDGCGGGGCGGCGD
jgi:uncharacterized protein (TIGR04222 family)